jgi:hypothetical protein
MRVSSIFRPAFALALALAGGALASQPAAAFDPAVQAVGWNGYGYGHGRGHWQGHHHRPPRYVYVPPRHVYVPPPPRYYRHW